MDKYEWKVWIKQRELELACWEETLAHDKLSDEDKQLYKDSIEKNKKKLSKVKEVAK